MKDMKRAIRRHHEARIKRYCERYIRNCWRGGRVDFHMSTWKWVYDEQGKTVQRYVLDPDWREKHEEWVRLTVQSEASHRPHFCQMCRTPRWDRRKDDPWIFERD